MELRKKRKKHFAELRAQEKRNKPTTKAQKRNLMSTYLKNMGGFKYTQLKSKTYEEIEKLFEIEMKRVNLFIPKDLEVEKSSKLKVQESSVKRAGAELEQEKAKKQKTDEHKDVEVDDEAELKKHIEIVKNDDVAIDAILLATKPPVIVEYKIGIDREDLQTLWKLVKAKHGGKRPEDKYERVLWGDLKVMFEPDRMSEVWRSLQGYRVTIWKLFDSCGVHYVSAAELLLSSTKPNAVSPRVTTVDKSYNCWMDKD
ncbi:hypothetical protein Tco_0675406 [Tanacetum coccineum]